MPILSITCEDLTYIPMYIDKGIDDIALALENSAFSALHAFSLEDIKKGISMIQEKGCSATIIMNALFMEDEIEQKKKELEEVISYGADYVVLSDFGLFQYAKQNHFLDKVIYDPITLMTSTPEAKALMDLGVGYVCISSVLTKEEIEVISKEVISSMVIHGYLLMSISKRPLLQEYAKDKGISLEKDKTYYIQEEKRDGLMPTIEKDRGMMIYSDAVLMSFQELNDFIKAGLKRLEIQTQFLDLDTILHTIDAYQDILSGLDPKEVEERYKKENQRYTYFDGYYGEKTIK